MPRLPWPPAVSKNGEPILGRAVPCFRPPRARSLVGKRPLDSEGGRAFFQERLAALGRVVFALFIGFYLFINGAYALLTPREVFLYWVTHPSYLPYLFATAAPLGLWLSCRGGRLSPETLVAMDVAATWLVCFLVALPTFFGREVTSEPLSTGMAADHLYTMLLVIAYVLVARAVFVPSPPRRTLGIGLASVVPALVAGYALQRSPPETRGPRAAVLRLDRPVVPLRHRAFDHDLPSPLRPARPGP